MNITIKACNNSLIFTSSAPQSRDWEEKFLLKENQAKILAWCKDHHVRALWDGLNKRSELVQDMAEANHEGFELLDKLHIKFMQFVNNLPSGKHCPEKSEVSGDKMFVKDILENWNGAENKCRITGAVILGKLEKNKEYLTGHITESLLKQMFEAWLQVYDK